VQTLLYAAFQNVSVNFSGMVFQRHSERRVLLSASPKKTGIVSGKWLNENCVIVFFSSSQNRMVFGYTAVIQGSSISGEEI